MHMAAFRNGWLDEEKTVLESLMCFKRAGADANTDLFCQYSSPVA